MITRKFWLPALAMMAGAVLVVGNSPAHAFNMNTRLQAIYQVDFTAAVSLGHTVIASSNMNRLYAAGAFEARCVSTITGAIVDQRGLPAESLLGGTQLYVTVPEWLPAQRIMPGFDQVPGGTTLNCSYIWTADAEESSYSVGIPGFGISVGGEKAHAGSSVPFEMYQPGSGSKDNNGCIH
jgi:hypothetical protein